MAAGGTWTIQNKDLPGVYTNIVGEGASPSLLGERGTCALPLELPWLPEAEVFPLYPEDIPRFVTDHGTAAIPVREAAKNARIVYVYRLNKGEKAKLILDNLTITAKYSGTFGNKLSVSIENVLGQASAFHVITWLDTQEIDRQTVADIDGLVSSYWVDFSAAGDKTLTINAGKPLTSGTDGTSTNGDYVSFFDAIEGYSVDALGVLSEEESITSLMVAFAKRMMNEAGKYYQCVGANIVGADFEGVHSVHNGVYLSDGTHIDRSLAVAYLVGAMAGVPLTENLTEHQYKGAVDVDKKLATSEQIKLATTGQMAFILDTDDGSNEVKIQKDINTLTTFVGTKTYAMSKGEVIRITYMVAKMLRKLGKLWIGKMGNSPDNRSLYHGRALIEFGELEKQGVLLDVTPEDIVVKKGNLIDDMEVEYAIRPVGVTEKIYNTVRVIG